MDTSKMKPDYTIRYILIGDAYVGKSNIISRFTENKFSEKYQATINLDFTYKTVKINDKICRVQLWDTQGQEQFQSITRSYFKNAACAIVVYDLTKRDTFNSISNWLEQSKTHGPSTITFVLVGNKEDLKDERVITTEEGEEFAQRNGMIFFETSAKTGKNIEEMFNGSIKEILKKIKEEYYKGKEKECGIEFNEQKKEGIVLKNAKEGKKKKCCLFL